MGEWNMKIWFLSNELMKFDLLPCKIWKADVASFKPSSEILYLSRIGLWLKDEKTTQKIHLTLIVAEAIDHRGHYF